MAPPFKMKGYTYPGTSPIREEKQIIPSEKNGSILDSKLSTQQERDSRKIGPTKNETDLKSEFKGQYAQNQQTTKKKEIKEKSDRKVARGEFWKDLAGEAGRALLIAGIQTGAAALSQGKTKPKRQGPDVSGFSGIQFGKK